MGKDFSLWRHVLWYNDNKIEVSDPNESLTVTS